MSLTRVILISLVIMFALVSISEASETLIATSPSAGSKIILKLKQVFNLNNDLIDEIVMANSFEGKPVKLTFSTESKRDTLKICNDNDEITCISSVDEIHYDDLPLYEAKGGVAASDGSQKFLKYYQVDNYKYSEFDHNKFSLCSNGKVSIYDSDYPEIILSIHGENTDPLCSEESLFEGKILMNLEEFKHSNPRVRETNLNGAEVIEFYWNDGNEEGFTYFDVSSYEYILSIERTHSTPFHLPDEGETFYVQATQTTYSREYSSDLSGISFELWDGSEQDTPDLTSLSTCPVELNPIQLGPSDNPTEVQYATPVSYEGIIVYNQQDANIVEELHNLGATLKNKELNWLNDHSQEGITEEEWNSYESLRISLPQAKCSNEAQFTHNEYKSFLRGTDFGFGLSKPDILRQIKRSGMN